MRYMRVKKKKTSQVECLFSELTLAEYYQEILTVWQAKAETGHSLHC